MPYYVSLFFFFSMCSKPSILILPWNLKTMFSQNGRNADTALWLSALDLFPFLPTNLCTVNTQLSIEFIGGNESVRPWLLYARQIFFFSTSHGHDSRSMVIVPSLKLLHASPGTHSLLYFAQLTDLKLSKQVLIHCFSSNMYSKIICFWRAAP